MTPIAVKAASRDGEKEMGDRPIADDSLALNFPTPCLVKCYININLFSTPVLLFQGKRNVNSSGVTLNDVVINVSW